MQADLRRRVAAFAAELAVDKFDELVSSLYAPTVLPIVLPPEELLELQEDIEDGLYRGMEGW